MPGHGQERVILHGWHPDDLGLFYALCADPAVRRWISAGYPLSRAEEEREYFFREGCYILELHNRPSEPEWSVARARVPVGFTTRWHRLRDTTERYLILAGRGRVEVGDDGARDVSAGEIISIPPMTRQRIESNGELELIFLAICTPRFQPQNYLDG